MNTDVVYATLAELRDRLPALRVALAPGTPRPWNEKDLSPNERARQNAQAVAERAAREINLRNGLSVLGSGQAPLRLDVLDAIAVIESGIAGLETAACRALGLTPLTGTTAAEQITRIIGLLDRIAAIDHLADLVDAEAVRLARTASWALGDVEAVVKFRERCPICRALSLRIFPERDLVLCVNVRCECAEDTCACHNERSRRHRWPIDFFRKLLRQELEQAS